MAHVNKHNVIETWLSSKKENKRFHLTSTGSILVSYGPRLGKAKMLYQGNQSFPKVNAFGYGPLLKKTVEEFHVWMNSIEATKEFK